MLAALERKLWGEELRDKGEVEDVVVMDEVEMERVERVGEKAVRMEERRGVKERKRFVRVEECILVGCFR